MLTFVHKRLAKSYLESFFREAAILLRDGQARRKCDEDTNRAITRREKILIANCLTLACIIFGARVRRTGRQSDQQYRVLFVPVGSLNYLFCRF